MNSVKWLVVLCLLGLGMMAAAGRGERADRAGWDLPGDSQRLEQGRASVMDRP